MRPKKHETTGEGDLFRARLDRIINLKHELVRKTVCPPLAVRWLALHWTSESCSDVPSRSSSQEDEPRQIIGKHLSESMSPS